MTDRERKEKIRKLIDERLVSFGFVMSDAYDTLLGYMIDKVEQDLKNSTNQLSVPDSLFFVWVERVCGEFLYNLYQADKLDGIVIEQVAKSIQLGDTKIDYGESGKDISTLFRHLMTYGGDVTTCYRRIKW